MKSKNKPIGTGTRQHFVDAQHVIRVHTNAHVKRFFTAVKSNKKKKLVFFNIIFSKKNIYIKLPSTSNKFVASNTR